jgi:hypothetical protein
MATAENQSERDFIGKLVHLKGIYREAIYREASIVRDTGNKTSVHISKHATKSHASTPQEW